MESAKRPNTAKQPYTTLPRICMTSVCDNCELRSLSRRWCSRVGEGRCSSCCNTFSSHCYICAASASPALRACVERVHLSETRNRLSTSYIGMLLHTLTPYHHPAPTRHHPTFCKSRHDSLCFFHHQSVPAHIQTQKAPSARRVILVEDVEEPVVPICPILLSPELAVELVTSSENVCEATGAVFVILHFAAQFSVEAFVYAVVIVLTESWLAAIRRYSP